MGGQEGVEGGGKVRRGDAINAPICTPPYTATLPPLFDPNTLPTTLPFFVSDPSYLDPNPSSFLDSFPSNSTSFLPPCTEGAPCPTASPSSHPGATIVSPIILGFTGVTGHVWALCYLHSTSPRASSRTVFHTFLLTLIWTDFLGKLATIGPPILAYAREEWTGGKSMCDYHGFTMVLICMVTHFTVMAMAVERFLGICHGYFYGRHVTTARCRYLLGIIWVFSSLFSLLPLFNMGEIFLQYPNTWCFANLHICPTTDLRHRIFTLSLGVINVANLVTIVVCNIFVVGSLLRMRVTRQVPSRLGKKLRGQTDHELQMVVVLVVITLVFTTSWAPLDMILVMNPTWPPHLKDEDHVLELVAVRLVSFNQIIDPWAYIICRVVFRSRAWRWCRMGLVGRGWSRRLEEGSGWSQHLTSLLHPRKLSRQQTNTAVPLHPVPQVDIDLPSSAPQFHVAPTLLPGLPHTSYSDSGTGSYMGMEVEGARPPHPCCLHPAHTPLLYTRSQPLTSPLTPHQLPRLSSYGEAGIVRSSSWGCSSLNSSTPAHALPSPTLSHTRSTQTTPPATHNDITTTTSVQIHVS